MTGLTEFKKECLPRVLTGALAGAAAYLLLSWLAQPGSLFGGPTDFAFTFCFNSDVPEAAGLILGLLLWALFGAEAGAATLPFADSGKELLARSLVHFAVTAATATAWVVLNFGWGDVPVSLFLLAAVYLLIWLTRWVGWFSEAEAIREKLGLTPTPSPLKWREVLPYLLLLGAVNALAMPLLRIFEGHYPVLTGFLLPFIIYPILAGAVGFHTGKHCGFTALVPIAVYLLSLLNDFWLWLAKVLSVANMAYGYVRQGLFYAAIALAFHALGVLVRRQRISRNEKKGGHHEKTSPAL